MMIDFYVMLIQKMNFDIEKVPPQFRAEVEQVLGGDENGES